MRYVIEVGTVIPAQPPTNEDIMDTKTNEQAFARIGNGEKVHPVHFVEHIGFGGKVHRTLAFSCGCPGARNGSAHSRAMIVRGATRATCCEIDA